MQLSEMAKPKKICSSCGNQMTGFHFWYRGGWRCKKSSGSAGSGEPALDSDTSFADAMRQQIATTAKRGTEDKTYLAPSAYTRGLEKILKRDVPMYRPKVGEHIHFEYGGVRQSGPVLAVVEGPGGEFTFKVLAKHGHLVDNKRGSEVTITSGDIRA